MQSTALPFQHVTPWLRALCFPYSSKVAFTPTSWMCTHPARWALPAGQVVSRHSGPKEERSQAGSGLADTLHPNPAHLIMASTQEEMDSKEARGGDLLGSIRRTAGKEGPQGERLPPTVTQRGWFREGSSSWPVNQLQVRETGWSRWAWGPCPGSVKWGVGPHK